MRINDKQEDDTRAIVLKMTADEVHELQYRLVDALWEPVGPFNHFHVLDMNSGREVIVSTDEESDVPKR